MNKCPICKNNNADKKNVHLIPWFLIKKAITQKGSGERDMELSFSIDTNSFTKIYFGRGILPENMEEYGELHELQKEKENPYSRNNIICTECEDKLSRLEAIFAMQFSDKNLKSANNEKTTIFNGHSLIIDTQYNFSLYELLIQSIFYRCSLGSFNGFKLNPTIEKRIEENLRMAFTIDNFKKVKSTEQIDFSNHFPIVNCSFAIHEAKDPTNNFIIIGHSKFPYFIMAGKWMFQLFEEEKHLQSSVEWLFSFSLKP